MEKIVVLDYSDASVNIYNITDDLENMESEEILSKLGYNIDECYIMYGGNITINRFDLKENQK